MKKWICLALSLVLVLSLTACASTPTTSSKRYFDLSTLTEEDRQAAASRDTQYLAHFGGYVGQRVEGNLKNWLYNAYESNPLMLDSIRQNGQTDIAVQANFWFGMYAPCVLRAAAGCWDLEKDQKLYDTMEVLIADSISCIETYGSLDYDATGQEFPLINPSWLNGVMAWYDATGSQQALKLGILIGDYYIEKAMERGINDSMPMDGIAELYIATREERFYDLLQKYILASSWTGGNYVEGYHSGVEYCDMPRHNWENVCEVEALGPLYEATGDETYLEALRFMYESIVLTDRRSNGANTTREGAVGSPYQEGSSETCGNVTFISMMAEANKKLKQSDIIDELEMSFWNSVLGAQDIAGRWWTYDTPQEGYRVASIKHLNWQSLQGAAEFSCCMSNCGLGIGTLANWASLRDETGIYLNYFGESEFVTATPAGKWAVLHQQASYPADGDILLTLDLEQPEEFTLHLRIPVWSENSAVKVNGQALQTPIAGSYYSITKQWEDGDVVQISLDMSAHFWASEGTHTGEVSIYYGPLLLALDQRDNSQWNGKRLWMNLENLTLTPVEGEDTYPERVLRLQTTDMEGNIIYLSDFATAGQSGTFYTTWFKNNQLEPEELQRNVCSWNQRLD